MRTLEYGKEQEKTLLFLPCTAEPEWAFADSVGLLSQDYHVIQIVYGGHGETGEDFISVETTVDEVTDWLQAHGITRLNAAYTGASSELIWLTVGGVLNFVAGLPIFLSFKRGIFYGVQ